MRVFLTIACGLAILLTGGCGLILLGPVPILGLPLALIAVLNVLMLAAVYGASRGRMPFYILGTADIILGLIAGGIAASFINDPASQGTVPVILGIAALVLAKGVFSFMYARTL